MWIEMRRPPRASMISVADLFFFLSFLLRLNLYQTAAEGRLHTPRITACLQLNGVYLFFFFFLSKSTDSPVKAVLVLGWRSTTCEMRRVLHLSDVFYTLDVGPCRGAGEASKRGPARCHRRAD